MEVSEKTAIRRGQDAGRREPDVPTRRGDHQHGGHDRKAEKVATVDPTDSGEIGPPVVALLGTDAARRAGDVLALRSRRTRPTSVNSRSHCHHLRDELLRSLVLGWLDVPGP